MSEADGSMESPTVLQDVTSLGGDEQIDDSVDPLGLATAYDHDFPDPGTRSSILSRFKARMPKWRYKGAKMRRIDDPASEPSGKPQLEADSASGVSPLSQEACMSRARSTQPHGSSVPKPKFVQQYSGGVMLVQ